MKRALITERAGKLMQISRRLVGAVPGLDEAMLKAARAKLNSSNYWEHRYRAGGNSGVGSYGHLAEYKAAFLNAFVFDNCIKRVVEFGCGDGAQLQLARYPEYIGLDVSSWAVRHCIDVFALDKHKSFFLYSPRDFSDFLGVFKSDASLSLDVIYHLVEDTVYHRHMAHLFSAARSYVIIYASNDGSLASNAAHVRHRRYTDWVERNEPDWRLYHFEPNPHASPDVIAEFRVFKRAS